jgi:tetratricopeptide (TPR) repeat protein
MFWRISHDKIVDQINAVVTIFDLNERTNALKKISQNIETYKNENPLSSESYLYSSLVNYYLGMSLVAKGFTELYLDDQLFNLTSEQRKYFIRSIKDSSKAIALLDDKDMEIRDLMILARVYFITGYKKPEYIYKLLKDSVEKTDHLTADDARFFSLLCLNGGDIDKGLTFLERSGGVEDSNHGRLFKAKALKDALKYTDAIIAFQKILKSTDDPYALRISHMNLGKIYFSQHLFQESLDHFTAALEIVAEPDCKIWIGKNYSALGMTDKAKIIWNEVLAANGDNEVVKKLLGLL